MTKEIVQKPLINIPKQWNISEDELYRIYCEEKKQAKIIREDSNATIRKNSYTKAYESYFKNLPFHPQFTVKKDKTKIKYRIDFQINQIHSFIKPNATFVEIGAGDCSLTIAISSYCKKAIALEVSQEISKNIKLPQNASYVLFDGFNFPLEDNSIDITYSNQLMEHLHPEDAEEQVKEIHRFLKSRGYYICITPNGLNGPHDISRFYGDDLVGFHMKEYRATELKKLFRQTGFRKVKAFTIIKKKRIYIPYWSIKILESILLLFKLKRRRKICAWPVIHRIINATIVAIK